MHHQPATDVFLERITDAFVALDKNCNYTYLNKKASELLNESLTNLLGKPIGAEFSENIGHPFFNICKQAIKKQEYVHSEEYSLPLDRWFENHIYPSADGLSIFFRDITKRKKDENELKESEIRYRRLFESAKDGILILDAESGIIVDANPYLLDLIGYSHTELSGKELWEIGSFKDIVASKEAFIQLQENEYIQYDDLPLKSKTGKIVEVEFVSNVYIEDNKKVIQCNIRDITERIKAEKEIKSTNEQLRQLTIHLQNIREEERKRIGREIHDELGQQLTAIKMDISWIDKKIPEESSIIKTKLKNVVTLLDGSNLSIRKILNELRSDILENHGIIDALKWQARQFIANTGIPLEFSSSETVLNVDAPIGTCLFRVFQETLTNITRYAEANKVISSLNYSDDIITLEIEDDGKGFDTVLANDKLTYGNLGMRERVASLNGKFELLSSPGNGTKIIITVPFNS